MRIALRASSIVSVVLLATCLALSQDKQSLNTDVLRDQIKKLESMTVEGKSASVQSIRSRALLSLYTQFQTALEQEIEDLKNIEAAVGSSSAAIQVEIAGQLRKLGRENADANIKLQALVAGLPAGVSSDEVSGRSTSGTPATNQPETESVEVRTRLAPPRGAEVSVPVGDPAGNGAPHNSPAGLSPAASASVNRGTQAGNGAGGQASTSLNADLNNRVKEAARARIQQRETTKQAETPSVSSSSTSLVDTSSAGDLVNVGLGLAGLSRGTNTNSTNSNSVSITTSAYALYAASQGADPLNPGFYNRKAGWRKLSLTLGYDDEKLKTGATQRAQIFGAKYLIIDKRDPSRDRHKADFKTIGDNLEQAAIAFGNLDEKVSYYFSTNRTVKEKILIPQFRVFLNERLTSLQSTPTTESEKQRIEADKQRITTLLQRIDTGRLFVLNSDGVPPTPGESGEWTREELEFYTVNFRNPYLGPDYRVKLKEAVGQQVLDDLDAFIARQLTDTRAFEDLSDTTRDALERIRRAPQFSFYFLTKQRPEGDDEYTGETIFDYGVTNRINLTLNGNYVYRDSKIIGGDTRGLKFSGQFRFQMTPEKLTGRSPLFLSVSGDGEAFSGRKPAFHAQAKLTIPILNGLDLPFSVTYANQRGLIKENKIRGQFGFSIDTSRLLQALTLK